MKSQTKLDTKKMVTLAVLAAVAYVVMFVGRIPLLSTVEFLKYDPKDIILAIAGFLYGPMAALYVILTVSVVEMVTTSSTGLIGLLMNVLSSAAFVCTAAYVYKKKKTATSALIGLILGCLAMTAVMLVWNYFITPYYMRVDREVVVAMLLPGIMPFNLLKSGLNAAFTLILYKPLVTSLRKARLLPESEEDEQEKSGINIGVVLTAVFMLVSCVFYVLIAQGIV